MGQILLKYKCTHQNGSCDVDMSMDHGVACKHGPCGELPAITLSKLQHLFPNTWRYIKQDDDKIKDLYNFLENPITKPNEDILRIFNNGINSLKRQDTGPLSFDLLLVEYIKDVYVAGYNADGGAEADFCNKWASLVTSYGAGGVYNGEARVGVCNSFINYLKRWITLSKDLNKSHNTYLVDIPEEATMGMGMGVGVVAGQMDEWNINNPPKIDYKNEIKYSLWADIINQFDYNHNSDESTQIGTNIKETLTVGGKYSNVDIFDESIVEEIKQLNSTTSTNTVVDAIANTFIKEIYKYFFLWKLLIIGDNIDFIDIINASNSDSKIILVDILKCSSHIFSCMYKVNKYNQIESDGNLNDKHTKVKEILDRKCSRENGKGQIYISYPINNALNKDPPIWYRRTTNGYDKVSNSEIDKTKCSNGDMFQIEKNIEHLRDRDLCSAIQKDDINLFIELLKLTERDKYCDRLLEYNHTGNTLLHETVYWEASKCFLHVITYLLPNNKTLLNITNSEGNTALHIACYKGLMYFIVTMIKIGANLDIINNKEEGMLHMAVMSGILNIVKYILNQDTVLKLSYRNKFGQTPLHLACIIDLKPDPNPLSIIQFLVMRGSDLLNEVNGTTILGDLEKLKSTIINLQIKTYIRREFYNTYNCEKCGDKRAEYEIAITKYKEYMPILDKPKAEYLTMKQVKSNGIILKQKQEMSIKKIPRPMFVPNIERKGFFSIFDSPENYIKIIPIIIVSMLLLIIIYKHFL